MTTTVLYSFSSHSYTVTQFIISSSLVRFWPNCYTNLHHTFPIPAASAFCWGGWVLSCCLQQFDCKNREQIQFRSHVSFVHNASIYYPTQYNLAFITTPSTFTSQHLNWNYQSTLASSTSCNVNWSQKALQGQTVFCICSASSFPLQPETDKSQPPGGVGGGGRKERKCDKCRWHFSQSYLRLHFKCNSFSGQPTFVQLIWVVSSDIESKVRLG